MITRHLTEDEVQQFVLNSPAFEAGLVEHVHLCEICKTKVANYRLLFAGIKAQPEPAFDFDLSAAVLAQLPAAKVGLRRKGSLVYLFVFAGIMLGLPLYIFRQYMKSIFSGITPVLIYLMLTAFIAILVIFVIDMHKDYQKKMNALDLY